MGSHIFVFLGVRQFFVFTVRKGTRMPHPRNNALLTSVNEGLVNRHLPVIFGELSPDGI